MSEIPGFKLTSDISVSLVQKMGNDSSIVAAAKVSIDGMASVETMDREPKEGLIRYLMQHRHGTPFEHASMTFLVHAPIFVWREWHRHRIGWSYNEESARYKTLDPVFYIPARERPMIKVEGWKPGRPKFKTLDEARSNSELQFNADYTYGQIVADMKLGYEAEYERYLRQIDRKLDP